LVENILKFRKYSKSGRTDKGVSALGNVIGLYVRELKSMEQDNYIRMINRNLPEDIRVLAMTKVNPDFNARYHCKQRSIVLLTSL
jgi:tRNA pseudouridine38/39 synthase